MFSVNFSLINLIMIKKTDCLFKKLNPEKNPHAGTRKEFCLFSRILTKHVDLIFLYRY